MTTLADIALVVALLVTLLLYMMQQSNRRLAGPDQAGAAIVYFILTPFRWLALALALGVAIGEGGFAWIGDSAAAQAILIYLVHIAAGVASVILLAAGGDRAASAPVKIAGAVVAYGVPLAVTAYAARTVNPTVLPDAGATTMRAILLGALALGLITTLAAAHVTVRASPTRAERRRAAAEAEADAEVRVINRMAQLEALSDQTPLWGLLDFTGDNEPPDVQERALAMIAARPALDEELATLLAGNWLVEALRYIRWHFRPTPAALALPIRDGLVRVADDIRYRIARHETPYPEQFELEVGQALDLAERYHGPAADFRPALVATRGALDLAAGRTAAPIGRARLDAWLNLH